MTTKLTVRQPEQALAVPEYIARGNQGLEDVDKGDLTFPRIDIAQSMSKCMKKSLPQFIEGIQEGDLYNSLTRVVYQQPLTVIPIRFYKNYIKFRPVEEGGGVVRMASSAGGIKPEELEFGPNGEKPAWTTLRNFLVYLPDCKELAIVSMKSTSTRIAKDWVALMKLFGNFPSYARKYLLVTVPETSKAGQSYMNFAKIQSSGYATREDFETAQLYYSQFSGREIVADDTDLESEENTSPF